MSEMTGHLKVRGANEMKPEIYSREAPRTYFRLPVHFTLLSCIPCFESECVPEVTTPIVVSFM